MRIESIEQTRSPQGKLRLRFEGGESMLVLPAVITELGLYAGLDVPEAGMGSLREQNAAASAKNRAVRILSAAAVSKNELEHRLVQKGESPEHAAQAAEWLDSLRLLDDRALAAQLVRSAAAKGYGEARVRQLLYAKRIPREFWEEALAQMPDQSGAIDEFLSKRFRGKAPDRAECRRATDALLRRGHRWQDIQNALERYGVMPEE